MKKNKKNVDDPNEDRSDDYFYDLQGLLLPQIPQEEKEETSPTIIKEEENTPYF